MPWSQASARRIESCNRNDAFALESEKSNPMDSCQSQGSALLQHTHKRINVLESAIKEAGEVQLSEAARDLTVTTGFFAEKYYKEQVKDTQRRPAFPKAGEECRIFGFKTPYVAPWGNRKKVPWSSGDYIMLVDLKTVEPKTKRPAVALELYDSAGNKKTTVSSTGYIAAMSVGSGNGDGFLIYIGVPARWHGTGYVISEKPLHPTRFNVTLKNPTPEQVGAAGGLITTTAEATTTASAYHVAVSGSYKGDKTGHSGGFTKSKVEKCLPDGTTQVDNPDQSGLEEKMLTLEMGTVCCDSSGRGSRPGCKTGTFADADKHCRDTGKRLCSLAQLKDGTGEARGCHFDGKLVWSSDICKVQVSTATSMPATTPVPTTTPAPTTTAETDEYVEDGGVVVTEVDFGRTFSWYEARDKAESMGGQLPTTADLKEADIAVGYDQWTPITPSNCDMETGRIDGLKGDGENAWANIGPRRYQIEYPKWGLDSKEYAWKSSTSFYISLGVDKKSKAMAPYCSSPYRRNETRAHLGKWDFTSADQLLHYVCQVSMPEEHVKFYCPKGWTQLGNSCYHAELRKTLTYLEANTDCRITVVELGMTGFAYSGLVVIRSEAENKIVQRMISSETVWIGLHLRGYDYGAGQWIWQDGTYSSNSSNYTNWEDKASPFVRGYDAWDSMGAFMNQWRALCKPPPKECTAIPKVPPQVIALIIICTVVGFTVMIALLAKLIFVCTYKAKVTDQRQAHADVVPMPSQPPQALDFHHGAFGCLEDINVCCHAFCCASVRAADTHKAMGTGEFWTVIFQWIVASVIGQILGGIGLMICGMVFAAVMAKKRQKLKARLGIAAGNSCVDFMFWWCCSPCAIAQEARHVDSLTGVAVRCCCILTRTRPAASSMVGSAVSLQPIPHEARAPFVATQQHATPVVFQPPSQQSPPQAVCTAQIVHIQPPGGAPYLAA
jgi:Cys-rich protein (TIGR01571 family)